MTSLEEVARRAGVSTATASRALNGRGRLSQATRDRVRAAASDLGYVVSASASSLATGRTRSIGVLVPLVDRWFFATVLDGIAARLAAAGYDITLYDVTDDPRQRAQLFDTSLRRGRVDAVIALSMTFSASEVAAITGLGLPVVGLGSPHPELSILRVDDEAVGRVAAEHLVSLGHRRLAHIGQFREGEPHDIPSARWRGFRDAVAQADLPPARFAPAADFTIDAGHRAMAALLADAGGTDVRPTAVFAASDELAFGALFAVQDAGLTCPGDVSIVGVDGHEMSSFFGLTTIEQFPRRQGELIADAALAALGEGTAPPPALPFHLVARTTTAPPA